MENLSWDDAVKGFDSYLEVEERSECTRAVYRRELRLFYGWFLTAYSEPPQISDIIESELRDWKQWMIGKNFKPNTINLRLRSMKAFLRWAVDEKMTMPIRMPRAEREQEKRPHWLTISEEHRLVRAIEKDVQHKRRPVRDLVIVTVLLRTGIRVGELAAAKWSDVNIQQKVGSLIIRRGKGAKRRTVPLDILCRDALTRLGYERYRNKELPIIKGPHGALTVRAIEGIILNLRWSAKLPELKCHTLRHTCLRRLIESGAKLQEAARIAGHTSINTTTLYILPNEADLQAAVDRRAAGEYRDTRELSDEG
jgi:integrase/recombinase XerC